MEEKKSTSYNELLNEELYKINRELLFKRFETKTRNKLQRSKNHTFSRWFIRKGGWMVAMWTLSVTLLLYVVFNCFVKQHMVLQEDDDFKEFVRKQAKAKSVNILNTKPRIETDHTWTTVNSEDNGDRETNNKQIDLSDAKLLTTNHSGGNSLLDPSCDVQIKDISNTSYFVFINASTVTYDATVVWEGERVNVTSKMLGIAIRGENAIIESFKLRLSIVIAMDYIIGSKLLPYMVEIPKAIPLSAIRFPKNDVKNEGTIENFIYIRDPFKNTNQTKDNPTLLLFMYLTNCAVPEHKLKRSLRDTHFMFPHACHMDAPNIQVLNKKSASQAAMLKKVFQQKENICMVPTNIIDILRISDDVISTTPSIGSTLIKLFTSPRTSEKLLSMITEIGEAIDGRIASVLHWYSEICENGISAAVLATPTRTYIHNEPIKQLETIDRHGGSKVMFVATFDDGKKAFVKLFQSCNHDFLGEGAKELLAFYAERAFGFNMFPNVVARRVYLRGKDDYKMISLDKKNFSIPFQMPAEEYETRVRNIFLEKDPEGDAFYMDLAFIGSIKDFKRFDYDTEELANVLFRNQTVDTTRGKHMATLQTFRDITSIVIFDFLTHNFDRKGDNWIRSSTRITPFDSGKAFDDVNATHSLICERMLQLPELEGLSGMFPGVTVGDLDRNVLHSCDAVPEKYRLCKFDRDSVDRVKTYGRNAVALLKQFIQNENKGQFNCVDVEKYNVFEGIQVRLDYILKYFDECYRRLGEYMYL